MMFCDLCSGDDLEKVYTPPTTRRGLVVYVCNFCGLIQSLPRIDHVENKEITISSGADWGNLRYGKQFDVEEAVEILSKVLDEETTKRVLDVGAGCNADFLKAMEEYNPMLMCYGMEPHFEFDNQDAYDDCIIRWKNRLEETNLEDDWLDAITFIHTLEHLQSPREALKKAYAALKNAGMLLVIVPNMHYLFKQRDIIEELFIDKHLYHFTPNTLSKYFYDCGFQPILSRHDNRETIAILGTKQFENELAIVKTKNYAERLQNNLNNLPLVASKINEMESVIIWGGGRILDALVNAGLDVMKVDMIIDNYLPVEQIHGRYRYESTKIAHRNWQPDIILICSREYANEIKAEAKELCPESKIIIWSELL